MCTAMLHETIWFDKQKYEQAEANCQRFLAGTLSQPHGSKGSSFSPVQEIAKARQKIQQTLSTAPTLSSTPAGGDSRIAQLEEENRQLKKVTEELRNQLEKLTLRVDQLATGNKPKSGGQTGVSPKKEEKADDDDDDDDDDDFDLFGSDEEEEDEDEKAERKARLAAYAAKKSKKPELIAKSNIVLDVKPWDDETDLKAMEAAVRSITCDGLVWGANVQILFTDKNSEEAAAIRQLTVLTFYNRMDSKFVPVAYGIQKLQISCVVEDDKIGTDFLEEKITEFEDFIQSVDVAAFNKV